MRSFRKWIILLTVAAIVITAAAVSIVGVRLIARHEHSEAEQLLLLMCETGERNLDYYFNSVRRSVEKVCRFVEGDLDGLDDKKLEAHVERVEQYFAELTYKTSGVFTYYYRIDPDVSEKVKGFWYTNVRGDGFEPHEVTDISEYDTKDTTSLVWFTVPKNLSRSIWLPPYVTENLDVRVISYNVPITFKGDFVGVVGIEIDYSAMAKQVESIRVGKSGYAFLNDADGNIFYHRDIDSASVYGESAAAAPDGLFGSSTFVNYTYAGVDKKAAWLPLSNGMRLTVCVPVSELDEERQSLTVSVVLAAVFTALIVGVAAVPLAFGLTKTLKRLDDDEFVD